MGNKFIATAADIEIGYALIGLFRADGISIRRICTGCIDGDGVMLSIASGKHLFSYPRWTFCILAALDEMGVDFVGEIWGLRRRDEDANV